MAEFKIGDLIVRKPDSGYGWNHWCEYMKDLGVSPHTAVTITRLLAEESVNCEVHVTYQGHLIGRGAWRAKWFDFAVEAKPLEDWL